MSDSEPQPSANLALGVLVVVAVVSPWLFGAVEPRATLAVTALGLVAAAAANYVDEFYVAEPATHGASMLDPGRAGGDVEKSWDAVLRFMASNR